jgi:hypothetical protein
LKIAFKSVAGLEEAKEAAGIVEVLENQPNSPFSVVKFKRGLDFVGQSPPGTGKPCYTGRKPP